MKTMVHLLIIAVWLLSTSDALKCWSKDATANPCQCKQTDQLTVPGKDTCGRNSKYDTRTACCYVKCPNQQFAACNAQNQVAVARLAYRNNLASARDSGYGNQYEDEYVNEYENQYGNEFSAKSGISYILIYFMLIIF